MVIEVGSVILMILASSSSVVVSAASAATSTSMIPSLEAVIVIRGAATVRLGC